MLEVVQDAVCGKSIVTGCGNVWVRNGDEISLNLPSPVFEETMVCDFNSSDIRSRKAALFRELRESRFVATSKERPRMHLVQAR